MNIEYRTYDFKMITGAERHHYSMFNVERSMLDVHLLRQLSACGATPLK
jgi:hypothetical protein